MSVYVNVRIENDMPRWKPGHLRFVHVDAVGEVEQAMWAKASQMPLAEWVQPFSRMGRPVALDIVLNPVSQKIICTSGFVDPYEATVTDRTITGQSEKPSAGYLSRHFYNNGNSRLSGAHVDSRRARKAGFLARNMQAFQEIDQRVSTQTISIAAINAGNYAWMSYGAVAAYKIEFMQRAKAQMAGLNHFAASLNLPVSGALPEWIEGIGKYDDAFFRKPFAPDSDMLLRQSLKSLLTGDAGFLLDPGHRFNEYAKPSSVYTSPLNATLTMDPRDADLQKHLKRRVEAALAL